MKKEFEEIEIWLLQEELKAERKKFERRENELKKRELTKELAKNLGLELVSN